MSLLIESDYRIYKLVYLPVRLSIKTRTQNVYKNQLLATENIPLYYRHFLLCL
jgi:hypothetical protein